MVKKAVEDIAAQVEENYEKENDIEKVVEFTSTGSDIYDLIGGGGNPWGKMVNVIGDNSTGKTLFACELIAQAHKKYGKDLEFVYDNAESGFSFDSKTIWGLDIEGDQHSETLEEFALTIERKIDGLKKGKKLIYVVDSLDALSSIDERKDYDKKMIAVEKGNKVDGTYGTSKAKGLHQFFRIMVNKIGQKDVLLVIISQVKENISSAMFAPKYIRTGGKSLDFYAAQIFWYAVTEKYGDKGRPTGVGIKVTNTKNKVGLPYRYGYVDILFDYGVDNLTSNLKFLYDLKTAEGKDKGSITGKNEEGKKEVKMAELDWDGAVYSYKELIKHIEENNLERELTKRVRKKWRNIEDSLKTDRKRKY